MRPLHRPMFRYGGPIKEGIMHGMKNGGRAALVGNPVYPKTDGREHHNILKTIFGWGSKGANVGKAGGAGQGIITKKIAPYWNKFKNWYNKTPSKSKEMVVYDPKKIPPGIGTNRWYWEKGVLPTAGAVKWGAGKALPYATTGGLILSGGMWLWPDGTPANENEINQHLSTVPGLTSKSKKPGRGDEGMYWEDPARLAAEAKAARTAKMEKYLDTMGYDKSKDTALSNALIDASAIVQEGTDEAGSLKDADWSKLINRAIQSTSKRLDKPEQIREAVGLMMTKADIEKDMNADQNQLNNDYKRMQIKLGEKSLAGTSFEEIISDRMIKDDMLKGKDLAALLRIKKGIDAKVISTSGMDADQDALAYATKIIANKKKEGTPYPPGHYIISDRIVVVDEQGNANKVL